MVEERKRSKKGLKIERPGGKFLIGFFAGLCSAIFPRLLVLMNVSDKLDNIVVYDQVYIISSLIFSVLVGVVVMILEWRVLNEPGKTFIMALSVPALITGAVNTNNAIQLYKDQSTSYSIEAKIQKDNPIPINETPLPFKKLSSLDNGMPKTESFAFNFFGVREAKAADSFTRPERMLAFKVVETLYAIVLQRVSDRQQAINRANELRAHIPNAEPVEIGPGQYLVILGGVALPRTDALLKANELRQNFSNLGLQVELIPIPKEE